MTDQVADALANLEDTLIDIIGVVRRAQHGSINALRELDRWTVYGGATDPFVALNISNSLAQAIREQTLRCPSAPGSEH